MALGSGATRLLAPQQNGIAKCISVQETWGRRVPFTSNDVGRRLGISGLRPWPSPEGTVSQGLATDLGHPAAQSSSTRGEHRANLMLSRRT